MSKLPEGVQEKIDALRDATQQALTIVSATRNSIANLSDEINHSTDSDRRATLAREIERLQDQQPAQKAKHHALANLNARVKQYLERLPARAELADAKPVRMKKTDEPATKAVYRLRLEITKLLRERDQVERASPTVKEAKAAAKAFVQTLASHVSPRLIIEHGKPFDIQFGHSRISDREPTALDVLTWVAPSFVQERLFAMIDENAKSMRQMTAEDRATRLDEIKSELFELERQEVARIDEARDDGVVIDQRHDVSIRALLGLAVSEAPSVRDATKATLAAIGNS